MTNKYNNVYIKDTFTVGGVYEKDGPLGKYFDLIHIKDMYFNEKSFEKAEALLIKESIDGILKKTHTTENNIDLIISGDLQNQIAASNYGIRSFKIPYLGVYSACATSGESLIIGATFIESKMAKNVICTTSSHNMVAEKQFRNPTEYGAPKKKTTTFTVTGSASVLLTNKKSEIKVESSTVGEIVDYGVKDINNIGAVMAPSACEVIHQHLNDLNRDASYYDLIITGDLGIYGKKVLIELLKTRYNIDISKNYNDTGTMIYDLKKQPVFAGGSGPACSALVNYSYILKLMKDKKLKKVLLVPTGAIFSPTFFYQKETIPGISHVVSLEVI